MEKRKVYRLLVVLLSLALIMTVFANLVGAEGEELVNHPPIVETYAFQITTANTSFTIDLLEFCNDPDPDDVLTILSINGPSHGTAILNRENGTVYYTPEIDFVGTDRFTYTVSDGSAATVGVIDIIVLGSEPPEYGPLKPVLESVTYYGQLDSGEHAWEAHWGWLSENEADIEALVCKFSGTVIGADNFPTTFAPGRQRDMFSTIFTSANLVWTLKGPDGSQRTATAARTPIPDDPEPTTGHLTIQKQLQGGGSDDAKFQIAIRPLAARSLNEGQEEPVYISVNEPWSGELEPGYYEVVELDMPIGYYFEEITDGGHVQVVAGGEYTITIVNSYEEPDPEPDTSSLIIRKQITGSSGYNRNARFLVAIQPYDEITPRSAAAEIQTVSISVNEPWSGELEAGTYSVREVETPNSRYSLIGISNEGIVVVAADETVEVIITSRYRAPAPAPDPEPTPEPEEPTAPEGPVEPEEPTAPEQPQEPEEPTKPEDPMEPVEPTTIEQADPGTLPKTSAIDSSLVLGSLLTLTGLWLSKKRS